MKSHFRQLLLLLAASFLVPVLPTAPVRAESARSVISALGQLERRVKSIQTLSSTSRSKYSQEASKLWQRFTKASNQTADQKKEFSALLSSVRREISARSSTASSTSSASRSTTSRGTVSSTRSSRSTSRSGSSKSATAAKNDALKEYYEHLKARYASKNLPVLKSKGGPLDPVQTAELAKSIDQFTTAYPALLKQVEKDRASVRRLETSSDYSSSFYLTSIRRLIEKDVPAELEKVITHSRSLLLSKTTGMLEHARDDVANRRRQEGNSVIFVSPWSPEECIQTAWAVAKLGPKFEQVAGGNVDVWKEVEKEAAAAAKLRRMVLLK